MWRILRAIAGSDIAVAVFALLVFSLAISGIWLYLSWLDYNHRFGIGFIDYLKMFVE